MPNGERVYTVQATAKRWKALKGIGVVLILGFLIAAPASDGHFWSIAMGLSGLGFFVSGALGRWWFHR